MKRATAFVSLVLFVMALCAVQAEPVKLAYKFTVGELDKYRMNMSMKMVMPDLGGAGSVPPIQMTMDTVVQQRTLDVLPDGSAKVRVTYSTPNMKITGGPKTKQPVVPIQTFSVITTIDPQGRTLAIEGMEKMFAASGLKNFNFSQFSNLMGQYAFLPNDPVDVGTTWKQTVPFPFSAGDMSVDSVLQSYGEQIWSQAAARISQKFTGHMDMGQLLKSVAGSMPVKGNERQAIEKISGGLDMNGSMTYLFAPAIGKLLKGGGEMWITLKLEMPGEAVKQGAPSEISMEMDMKMTLTRFK